MYVTSLCQSRGQGEGKILCDDVVCAFFASSFATEGVVSEFVMQFITADARNVLRENWKSEFPSER